MKTIVRLSLILPSLLALAASCGQVAEEEQGEKTYTVSIEASKGESPVTKALEITTDGEGHHVLHASWETTDIISVTKWDRVLGTLSPKTNGPSAVLTGTVTGELRAGHVLYLTMPGDGTQSDYTGQDGTLESIASRYDYIYGTTTVTSIENGALTCEPVTFSSNQAIVKFILNDGEGNPVRPSRLVLSAQDGSGNSMLYTMGDSMGQIAVDLDMSEGGTNEIYVALKQYSDASIFQVNAHIPGYVYRKQKTTTTYFEPGKYYEITVNMGSPEVDPAYTLNSFRFNFDFNSSMQTWPVFVFFDGISTGYWFDADGSGVSDPGHFVDLGGSVVADLALVRKVTAVSMPRLTDQRPVFNEGKWTFDQIEGWRYIGAGKVGCEFSLVEGDPCLSADITLAAPATTGKEIRVYNNADNVRVAHNNLIPMGLASISSDGLINEVSPDPGGWISLVNIGSTATYGYAQEVASPASFAYLALERKSGGTTSYYHMFKASANAALTNETDPNEGIDFWLVQSGNGADWIQVGAGHYATVGGMTWWTTNLAADRYTPEPHPWKATPLSWTLDTEGNSQFNADRNTRSLSEATFYDDSELPTINYDYMVFFSNTNNYQFKLRACGVNGVIFADNADPTKFIFLAVPDREDYEFVYYYSDEGSYIVYRANDYYWAKEYNSEQDHQHFDYDGSYGEGYWNFYCTSAFSINLGSYPTYRFPFTGTGMDGYGLPDFGCSPGPIEGRRQPIRVYLPARPVKK